MHFGHVKMYVTPYHISWIKVVLDYEPSYTYIVGIPMGTKCAPLESDLILYCYERDLLRKRSHGFS